ncbi:MAG: CheY-like chemotaxis protein [Bacteriovoracaceae bacterium]
MKKKTILSIDDDPTTNLIIKTILNKYDFNSITTEKPEDFLSILKETEVDLCIIDLNLGAQLGAGYQLIQAIRNVKGWELPLFVLSSRSQKEDIANALSFGATDFLFKPIDDVVLLDRISQFIDVTDPFSPLPYFKLKKNKGEAKVNFSQAIVGISEIGITIEGEGLLAKGTHVLLNGKAIDKIFNNPGMDLSLTVSNAWRESSSEKYRAFLEFDADNSDLLSQAKSFIELNSN